MVSKSHRHRQTTPPATTFIHTDPSNFRAIVQYLTGTSTAPPPLQTHQPTKRKANPNLIKRNKPLFYFPITPLEGRPVNWISLGSSEKEEEERAMAEKGFYLHRRAIKAGNEPRLLPLFPLQSGFSGATHQQHV